MHTRRRLELTIAFERSDQSLRCPPEDALVPWLSTECLAKSDLSFRWEPMQYCRKYCERLISELCTSGPEVIKLFSCSTQLSMKFVLLINFKLPTIANSFLLNIAEHENFSDNKYENANYCWHFHIY